MAYLKLLRRAYVQGQFLSPDDGVVIVDDADEAQRLIAAGTAEDVSADFEPTPAPAPDPGA